MLMALTGKLPTTWGTRAAFAGGMKTGAGIAVNGLLTVAPGACGDWTTEFLAEGVPGITGSGVGAGAGEGGGGENQWGVAAIWP